MFVNKIECELVLCTYTTGRVIFQVWSSVIVVSVNVGWLVKLSLRIQVKDKRIAC